MIYTEQELNSSDGMLTKVWGPCMWFFLHTISFNYPTEPTKLDKENATADHIIPISDGGNNCQVNLVVCCKDCNNERGNMDFNTYVSIKKKNIKGKLFI
jgi:hypothetical protein